MIRSSAQHGDRGPTRAPGVAMPGRALARAVRRLADIVLPPQCLSCGALAMQEGAVCAACWSGVELISAPLCPRTGLPFAYDPGPGILSAEALIDPPVYDRARAVARFGEVTRTLIHALKYRDRLETAPMMGRWMARAGAELTSDCDVVMPVPLHRLRRWRRRYNQSALLAREIAACAGRPVDLHSLTRARATAPQVGLERRARRRNVAGAFAVASDRRHLIEGRRVLLVDDVITTGATVDAGARALLAAGAAGVDVLVFARVVDTDAMSV